MVVSRFGVGLLWVVDAKDGVSAFARAHLSHPTSWGILLGRDWRAKASTDSPMNAVVYESVAYRNPRLHSRMDVPLAMGETGC